MSGPDRWMAAVVVLWLALVISLVLAVVGSSRVWGADPIPITAAAARVEAGRELFYERALSIDFSTSCGGCHQPERAYTDGLAVAVGMRGNANAPEGFLGDTNTPTVLGAIFKAAQFKDGRAASIADQALQPWTNPAEMGLDSIEQGLRRLADVRDPDGGAKYRRLFALAYGSSEINADRCADALAYFEATLTVTDAPVQLFLAGHKGALDKRQLNGFRVFERSGCIQCHSGRELRDGGFHNNGYAQRSDSERGRNRVTGRPEDLRSIATPTLIQLAMTAPYMHDGGLKTITDVVAHYNSGGGYIQAGTGRKVKDKRLDPRIKVLNLSPEDFHDLVYFLETATAGTVPYFPDPQKRLAGR